ncbi:MAG: nucleotidyltransferase domain-containing protein [Candidatus Altiarchaeota archaeon]
MVKILQPFLQDLNSIHHGSEIARVYGLNQKTVSNLLNRLEAEGLLKSKMSGKNKEFTMSFDDREKTMRLLMSAENARTIMFMDDNPRVKEILSKVKRHMQGIVIIFGSYAKGLQKKDSDLDLFLVGEYHSKEVEKISQMYGLNMSVKQMMPDDFKEALRAKEVLIREVASHHILVQGLEDYFDAVSREYYGR